MGGGKFYLDWLNLTKILPKLFTTRQPEKKAEEKAEAGISLSGGQSIKSYKRPQKLQRNY